MSDKKKKEQSVETEVFAEDELARDEQPEAKAKKKEKKSKKADIVSEDEMIMKNLFKEPMNFQAFLNKITIRKL